MNKDEFFKSLSKALLALPADERGRTELFYQELFSDLMEDGCSEEEAVARLGDPDKIVADLLEERGSMEQKFEAASKGKKAWVIVLLAIGFPLWGSLLLTAFLLLMVAYMLLWIPVVMLGAMAVAFMAAALGLTVMSPALMFHNLPLGIVQLGCGFLSVGLAIFSAFGLYYCCKGIAKATKVMTGWFFGFFKKERRGSK